MAIGKSIVDVLRSITGKKVDTIADGLEEALSGGGSGGGGVMVAGMNIDEQTGTAALDKTWNEINNFNGLVVLVFNDPEIQTGSEKRACFFDDIVNDGSKYYVNASVDMSFETTDPDDYPVLTQGD